MVVGIMQLDLRLEGVNSLKDKRHVIRSLVERLRRDFQVAVAEVDDHELWGNSVVGLTYVSNDAHHIESLFSKLIEVVESRPDIELVGQWQTIDRH